MTSALKGGGGVANLDDALATGGEGVFAHRRRRHPDYLFQSILMVTAASSISYSAIITVYSIEMLDFYNLYHIGT